MKAITTKYVGPTNTHGARIVADDGDGNRVTIPRDYSLDASRQFRQAAVALAKKMGWGDDSDLIGGSLKRGGVFVFLPSGCRCRKGSSRGD